MSVSDIYLEAIVGRLGMSYLLYADMSRTNIFQSIDISLLRALAPLMPIVQSSAVRGFYFFRLSVRDVPDIIIVNLRKGVRGFQCEREPPRAHIPFLFRL